MSEIEITIDASVRELLSEYSTPRQEISLQRIEAAVRSAAAIGRCDDCQIGVRISDDVTIHEINLRFLQHDYPTDVISFPYQFSPPLVQGELIVSIDTAAREAIDAGWSIAEELLLYLIHGTLHLVGFDDTEESCRLQMREAERTAMRNIGAVSL